MQDTIIEIKDLHKSFGKKSILKGINLDVFKGEILCIIGQSGIGKSVLLKHINGLLLPDKGHILYKQKNIMNFNKKEIFQLRKNIGLLFQSGALFDSMSVWENLALPLQKHKSFSISEINQIIKENLSLVGLENIENLNPSELSGGMRKRVGLARAIILRPEVIMYDEPTTGLDPIMSSTINNLILNLNHKLSITSIVITHDMKSVSSIASRIAMIHEGKIIFTGNKKDLYNCQDTIVKNFVKE